MVSRRRKVSEKAPSAASAVNDSGDGRFGTGVAFPENGAALFAKKAYENHVVVLYLDARLKVLATEVIGMGELATSKALIGAIAHGARAIVCGRLYPDGEPRPARTDLRLMKDLNAAGKKHGILILDFVIFTRTESWSGRMTGTL